MGAELSFPQSLVLLFKRLLRPLILIVLIVLLIVLLHHGVVDQHEDLIWQWENYL